MKLAVASIWATAALLAGYVVFGPVPVEGEFVSVVHGGAAGRVLVAATPSPGANDERRYDADDDGENHCRYRHGKYRCHW